MQKRECPPSHQPRPSSPGVAGARGCSPFFARDGGRDVNVKRLRGWLVLPLIAGATIRAGAETMAAVSAGALDLAQCFELAKKQSESLQISVEQIQQLEQQYRAIFAATLPNLTLNGSQFWQEAGGGGGSTFSSTSKPQVNFTLTQPLFSGFREY